MKVKRELFSLLPSFFFFLLAFNWINWIDGLMIREEGLHGFSFVSLLIASAVVAKVLLLVDHFPWINLFNRRPLIYTVVWKTALYGTGTLLVRLFDRLIPPLLENPETGYRVFLKSVHWEVFWAVQIWYFTIFLVFVFSRELLQAMGWKTAKRLLFKRGAKTAS
jgi:hypothetical protein